MRVRTILPISDSLQTLLKGDGVNVSNLPFFQNNISGEDITRFSVYVLGYAEGHQLGRLSTAFPSGDQELSILNTDTEISSLQSMLANTVFEITEDSDGEKFLKIRGVTPGNSDNNDGWVNEVLGNAVSKAGEGARLVISASIVSNIEDNEFPLNPTVEDLDLKSRAKYLAIEKLAELTRYFEQVELASINTNDSAKVYLDSETVGSASGLTLPSDRTWVSTGINVSDDHRIILLDIGSSTDDYHVVGLSNITSHEPSTAGGDSDSGGFEVIYDAGNSNYAIRVGHTASGEILIANGGPAPLSEVTIDNVIVNGVFVDVPVSAATPESVQEEREARIAADNSLSTLIETNAASITNISNTLSQSIQAETTARTNADTRVREDLTSSITSLQTDLTTGLTGKANTNLSNLPSNLTETQKNTIITKLGIHELSGGSDILEGTEDPSGVPYQSLPGINPIASTSRYYATGVFTGDGTSTFSTPTEKGFTIYDEDDNEAQGLLRFNTIGHVDLFIRHRAGRNINDAPESLDIKIGDRDIFTATRTTTFIANSTTFVMGGTPSRYDIVRYTATYDSIDTTDRLTGLTHTGGNFSIDDLETQQVAASDNQLYIQYLTVEQEAMKALWIYQEDETRWTLLLNLNGIDVDSLNRLVDTLRTTVVQNATLITNQGSDISALDFRANGIERDIDDLAAVVEYNAEADDLLHLDGYFNPTGESGLSRGHYPIYAGSVRATFGSSFSVIEDTEIGEIEVYGEPSEKLTYSGHPAAIVIPKTSYQHHVLIIAQTTETINPPNSLTFTTRDGTVKIFNYISSRNHEDDKTRIYGATSASRAVVFEFQASQSTHRLTDTEIREGFSHIAMPGEPANTSIPRTTVSHAIVPPVGKAARYVKRRQSDEKILERWYYDVAWKLSQAISRVIVVNDEPTVDLPDGSIALQKESMAGPLKFIWERTGGSWFKIYSATEEVLSGTVEPTQARGGQAIGAYDQSTAAGFIATSYGSHNTGTAAGHAYTDNVRGLAVRNNQGAARDAFMIFRTDGNLEFYIVGGDSVELFPPAVEAIVDGVATRWYRASRTVSAVGNFGYAGHSSGTRIVYEKLYGKTPTDSSLIAEIEGEGRDEQLSGNGISISSTLTPSEIPPVEDAIYTQFDERNNKFVIGVWQVIDSEWTLLTDATSRVDEVEGQLGVKDHDYELSNAYYPESVNGGVAGESRDYWLAGDGSVYLNAGGRSGETPTRIGQLTKPSNYQYHTRFKSLTQWEENDKTYIATLLFHTDHGNYNASIVMAEVTADNLLDNQNNSTAIPTNIPADIRGVGIEAALGVSHYNTGGSHRLAAHVLRLNTTTNKYQWVIVSGEISVVASEPIWSQHPNPFTYDTGLSPQDGHLFEAVADDNVDIDGWRMCYLIEKDGRYQIVGYPRVYSSNNSLQITTTAPPRILAQGNTATTGEGRDIHLNYDGTNLTEYRIANIHSILYWMRGNMVNRLNIIDDRQLIHAFMTLAEYNALPDSQKLDPKYLYHTRQ